MSLGYNGQQKIVSKGDTARLSVRVYDDRDQLYSYEDLASVTFKIQSPIFGSDGTKPVSVDDAGSGLDVQEGSINEDGSGSLDYDSTNALGHYVVVATFELVDGTHKSVRADFEVSDPFAVLDTQIRIIADGVWTKLNDCFDAESDGPWVQDMTLNFFREEKMEKFINDALFDINYMNPPTALTMSDFVLAANNQVLSSYPLIVQGVFIQVLRHLIRSYVEQPMPTGANIAWQDRRDYLQRWQSVFELEKAQYDKWVALYKRGFLQLGHSRLLVAAKAGRLIPAPMRARSAGRGYW